MSGGPIVQHAFTFSIAGLSLTGFGLAMMAAFGVAHWVSQQVLAQRGDDPEIMNDVTFAALVGTIIGAKVYFAILQRDVTALWGRAGFVFWGGFIGSVVLCWAVVRFRKANFRRIADGTAVGIAAGYAIGRTGCWAVGDDYGRVWASRFAVAFPEGAPPSTVANMNTYYRAALGDLPLDGVVGVYPTQLLEVLLGLVMFVVLWRLRLHHHRAGWLFGMYCVLAGAERFIVEFFRAKSDMIGPLTSAQLVALGVAAAGIVLVTTGRADDSLSAVRSGR
ncbi:MAG: prolipoprotein diacylglyceryl transferase [Gemmatimonadaceae bacterium]|nr:prolipoprotein diacylglyceryl transferase [Gemmatimonadaceae bacterium]